MAGFGLGGGKLKKRKEIELDDFFAFSLSSPATKIRRLASGWRAEDDDAAAKKDKNYGAASNSLAVVPWTPSCSPTPVFEISQAGVAPELMEAEKETEAATMEVGDNNDVMVGGTSVAEGLHQWQQQQHCMLPPPPENTSTPIVWYR